MVTTLRPLSTGELLDRTFSLYRTHFLLFVGIVALPNLILLAFQLLGAVLRPPGPGVAASLWAIFWALGAVVVSFVAAAAAQSATVVAVSEVHLDRPASVLDAYSRVKHRILAVIGLTLVIGMATGLGIVLCIVPGVLLILMWSLAVPAAILENKGLGEALSRSQELTKGNRGRIFVIWLLFLVLTFAMLMLLQWPITLAALAMTKSSGTRFSTAAAEVASAVAAFISQCLAGPLATIAFSIVYYDERVRREAFDLQLMMTTLDGSQNQNAPA